MAVCLKLLALLAVVGVGSAIKSPLDCDFESSCHYIQDKTDAHDWQLNSGHTATANTGPDNDHTLHTAAGHYIYFESSGGNSGKNVSDARLFSPYFTANRGQCLSFYYHMFGKGIGALNIYLDHVDAHSGSITFSSQLWSRVGQQSQNGSDWLHALVPLDSGHGSKVKIVFEAVKGTSYLGDIALDDILLVNSCSASTDPPTVQPATSTPGPSASSVPSLTVTGDVHIRANPSSMHAQFTKNLLINCSYVHGNGSDFSTLVSLLLSMKNASGQTTYTELATITAFSNDQLAVKHDIGAAINGHLAPTGESFITLEWLYPGDQVLGEYKCEGFGLDLAGHPRVSSMTTTISPLALDCETVLPKYKDGDLKLDDVTAKLNKLVDTLLETSASYNNHTYSLSRPLAVDVDLGARLCDVSGGYLVEVNDRSEFEFLANFTEDNLNDNQTSAIVLGSSNSGHPSQWTFLSSAGVMSYFNWIDGPSTGDDLNCLFLGQTRKMFNGACTGSEMVRLVCEIPE